MSKHLTPSDVCERIIGRPEVIGAAIGADPKLAYSWRRGGSTRDAGDIPSARHMRALLAYARARALPLMAQDLIYGASEADIAARLAQMNAPAAAVAGDACGAGTVPAPEARTGGGLAHVAPASFSGKPQAEEPTAQSWGNGAGGMVACAPAGAGSGGPAPASNAIRGAA